MLLAQEGALYRFVKLTTGELAGKVSVSQQTVSRWISGLEEAGLIYKNKQGFRITQSGREFLQGVHLALDKVLSKKAGSVFLQGTVTEGFGDGAYYTSLPEYKKQLKKSVGFEAFPGTLNIRLSSEEDLRQRMKLDSKTGLHVRGFTKGKRRFGSAKCFPALVNGKVKAAVIIPQRSHYSAEVVELIAPLKLRKALKLKDNSIVEIEVKE